MRLVLALLAFTMLACDSSAPEASEPKCVVGAVVACACGGGVLGDQTCGTDGTFSACENCGSPSTGAGGAGGVGGSGSSGGADSCPAARCLAGTGNAYEINCDPACGDVARECGCDGVPLLVYGHPQIRVRAPAVGGAEDPACGCHGVSWAMDLENVLDKTTADVVFASAPEGGSFESPYDSPACDEHARCTQFVSKKGTNHIGRLLLDGPSAGGTFIITTAMTNPNPTCDALTCNGDP